MNIKIASAPVSWGVMLKDTPNVPPWSQVLDEISEAGYIGTELGPYGFLPLEKSRLQSELAQRSLTLISAYVPINLVDLSQRLDEYEEGMTTLRFLNEMGCEWLVLSDALFVDELRSRRAGRIRPEDGLQGEEWTNFIQNSNQIAKMALDEYRLKTVFHPHVGAYIETLDEVHRFLADTDPDLVGLCLDPAHIVYGGGDPVEITRTWGNRIQYLHLKDCDTTIRDEVVAREGDYFDGVKSGVFPELGQGSVDFKSLFAVLNEIEFDGWAIVEQDIFPDDPDSNALASAKRNREYLRQMGIG